ncbi:unnamed protein product [Caenorhabditis angaria]|uniref:Uncharacterized protein n=1 Tax=Caenorhabditis angaria TaxID=860376 RepID=A0A9P1J1I9_9PELO|nr:unnamed protein product [Caenorhabditis angaria]
MAPQLENVWSIRRSEAESGLDSPIRIQFCNIGDAEMEIHVDMIPTWISIGNSIGTPTGKSLCLEKSSKHGPDPHVGPQETAALAVPTFLPFFGSCRRAKFQQLQEQLQEKFEKFWIQCLKVRQDDYVARTNFASIKYSDRR